MALGLIALAGMIMHAAFGRSDPDPMSRTA
jgi:hypothetical protein